MDLNEEHKDLFIPQWFDKSHFESFLNIELTNEKFQKLKDQLIDGSGDYLADLISESVRIELNAIMTVCPEILK